MPMRPATVLPCLGARKLMAEDMRSPADTEGTLADDDQMALRERQWQRSVQRSWLQPSHGTITKRAPPSKHPMLTCACMPDRSLLVVDGACLRPLSRLLESLLSHHRSRRAPCYSPQHWERAGSVLGAAQRAYRGA